MTLDVSRLIRLPWSIHGGTGFIACEVPDIDKFVYYRDPVALGESLLKVRPLANAEVPLKDKVFELEKEKAVELPEYAAFYCVARGLAEPWQ